MFSNHFYIRKKTVRFLTALLILFFAFLSVYNYLQYRRLDLKLRASARSGGEYIKFLQSFVNDLNSDPTKYKIRIDNVQSPDASSSTIKQIENAEADLGIVQLNSKINSNNISAIATVFIEPFFLFSNKRNIRSINDIISCPDTLNCVILGKNTQTASDLSSLLSFYGIDSSRINYCFAAYDSSYFLLHDHKVDLGFFIVGLGNHAIRKMMCDTSLHLVHFENIDAYLYTNHKLAPYTLPKGLYGLNFPAEDFSTFATKALLVARSQMDDSHIYELTRALFEREAEISSEYPFLHLEKISEEHLFGLPVHPGSVAYFNKNAPSFLDRNATLIATVLSVIGLILSSLPLLYQYRTFRTN